VRVRYERNKVAYEKGGGSMAGAEEGGKERHRGRHDEWMKLKVIG